MVLVEVCQPVVDEGVPLPVLCARRVLRYIKAEGAGAVRVLVRLQDRGAGFVRLGRVSAVIDSSTLDQTLFFIQTV